MNKQRLSTRLRTSTTLTVQERGEPQGRVAAKYKNDSTNLAAFQGYKEGLPYTQETDKKTGHKPPRDVMKAEETNVTCEGSTFDYRSGKKTSTSNPDPAHTEARIIEDLFKENQPPPMSGSLLMAINWPQTGSDTFKEVPCPECERLICGAMKCGLEIILCIEGKPEKQDEGECLPSQAPSS